MPRSQLAVGGSGAVFFAYGAQSCLQTPPECSRAGLPGSKCQARGVWAASHCQETHRWTRLALPPCPPSPSLPSPTSLDISLIRVSQDLKEDWGGRTGAGKAAGHSEPKGRMKGEKTRLLSWLKMARGLLTSPSSGFSSCRMSGGPSFVSVGSPTRARGW